MLETPVVSIVIPTYNRLDYLVEAIESVRSQTVGDWELVVVDDGSTDGSVARIEAMGDPRIIVVSRAHTGNRSALRNAGVARSRADWIAFLDSDDLWAPDKLATQLRAVADAPHRRWSCTGIRFIDADGNPIAQRAGLPYRAQSGWILEQLLTLAATTTMPTLLVHRSLFDEVDGFDESFLLREDYEFELRLAAHSEIQALQEPLTIVRHHAGRTSSNRRVAELHRGSELVYRKVAATTTSSRIRAICHRRCADHLIQRARALSRDGEHAAAVASAARAVRDTPLSVAAWRSVGGSIIRSILRRSR